MGYDLKPRNKDAEWFSCNIGGYTFLMTVVGGGKAIGLEFLPDGKYAYVPDRNGYDPICNDGYYVTAQQAREMSDIVNEWLRSGVSLDYSQHRIDFATDFRDWLRHCSGYWTY